LSQSRGKMNSNKLKRGELEISFGWLFAILAGIVIIFLAIYLSSKLINSQQKAVSAETGTEIGILLNPLETNFESSQTTSISIPAETRINNSCDTAGIFGKQAIKLQQKSFGKWADTDVKVSFSNKYIFSNLGIEGKKFYIFSKPFEFPFKIADLIYITPSGKRYCFSGAPEDIQEEISQLKQSNLIVENCIEGDIKVCFGASSCEINVDFSTNSVKKNGNIVYFSGNSLMYAAIFSDKPIYECQVKRLVMRLKELSSLYASKQAILENKGCESNIREGLNSLSEIAGSLRNSAELGNIETEANTVQEINNGGICMLW
jgi:hypothetical protein